MRESSENFREGAGNMDLLKRRIIEDGTELGTEVVKVDSFLNHQLDIGLFMAIGKEISRRFGDLGINKILTIESSGIGIAAITALYFDLVPVVFAKKTQPNTMTEDFYGAEVKSFTKGTVSVARVSKQYLNPEDRVLIIDNRIMWSNNHRKFLHTFHKNVCIHHFLFQTSALHLLLQS